MLYIIVVVIIIIIIIAIVIVTVLLIKAYLFWYIFRLRKICLT